MQAFIWDQFWLILTIFENGRLKENDRVVAISGSPKAMSGATSTARLYRVTEDGSVDGDEWSQVYSVLINLNHR